VFLEFAAAAPKPRKRRVPGRREDATWPPAATASASSVSFGSESAVEAIGVQYRLGPFELRRRDPYGRWDQFPPALWAALPFMEPFVETNAGDEGGGGPQPPPSSNLTDPTQVAALDGLVWRRGDFSGGDFSGGDFGGGDFGGGGGTGRSGADRGGAVAAAAAWERVPPALALQAGLSGGPEPAVGPSVAEAAPEGVRALLGRLRGLAAPLRATRARDSGLALRDPPLGGSTEGHVDDDDDDGSGDDGGSATAAGEWESDPRAVHAARSGRPA
jgi:hypothetical protein